VRGILGLPELGPEGCRGLDPMPPELGCQSGAGQMRVFEAQTSLGFWATERAPSQLGAI
jgi:hypothetical protein